jgi:nitrogenase-associated protein
MAYVIFYEKPGCINNTRQKRLLIDAGHELECHNLLTEQWQADELRSYFGGLPVEAWFNPGAPAIRQGDVVPTQVDEQRALTLMQSDPLLIRRPLIRVCERRHAGFDPVSIDAWIGLGGGFVDGDGVSLERCARTGEHEQRCETPV